LKESDDADDFQITLKVDSQSSLYTAMKFVDTQTNNILILIFINTNFVTAKDKAIVDAKIMMKSRDARDSNTSLKLNDKIIKRKEKKIYFRQIT
jgi:hypothetical protein